MIDKTAMRPLAARTLEAMIGAAIGGGVGATGGYATYAPDSPLEWTDTAGRIHGRGLTEGEREERVKRTRKAAGGGAAIGAIGSGGASKALRMYWARREAKDASKAVGYYLDPLRSYVKKLQKNTGISPTGQTSLTAKTKKIDRDRLFAASDMLEKMEQRVRDLHHVAAKERDKRLWGGIRMWPVTTPAGKRLRMGSPKTTHEGMVVQELFGNPAMVEAASGSMYTGGGKKVRGLPAYYRNEIDRRIGRG